MKRLLCVLSIVVLMFSLFATESILVSAEKGDGDVNGDGVINSTDARLILQYSIGNCNLEASQALSADVSKNNLVNFKDVDYLWGKMIGKAISPKADSNKTETTVFTSATTSSTSSSSTSSTSGSSTSSTTSTTQTGSSTKTTKSNITTTKTIKSTVKNTTNTSNITTKKTTKKTTIKTTKKPTATTTIAASSGAKAQAIPSLTAVRSPKYTPSIKTSSVKESTYMSKVKVKNSKTGKVYACDTKEKLQLAVTACVKYELGNARSASSSTEAWKAQAVLCYTNICRSGGTFTISLSSDVNLSNANDKKIYTAVGDVLGQKLMVSSSTLAESFYFAYASNSTSTCGKYYVEDKPYLQSVYSPETSALVKQYYGSDAFVSEKEASMSNLLSALSDKVGYTVSIEPKSKSFSLYATEWDGAYVYKTNLYYTKGGSKIYITGRQIRDVLGLKSSSFSVIAQSGDTITIHTQGYGHGVGMSQIGAVIYANEYGWNYKQILAHYYSITSGSSCQIYGPNW